MIKNNLRTFEPHFWPKIKNNRASAKFLLVLIKKNGVTRDAIATCNLNTEETEYQLRDLDGGRLSFWHFWPAIDQDGAHKEKIDKTRIELKEILSRVREML